MSPARSIKRVPVHVWIPPTYSALYKIEITRADGTTDDVSDKIIEGELTDGITDTIGSFSFVIDNSSEEYTNVWSGNEIIRLYVDYATSAATARFRGRIEKVSYPNQTIKITGRSESAKLLDITVTKSYDDQETSTILTDLFDTYATSFTYTNVNTSTTNVTANWYQVPFWDCVQDLCHSAGFDCYIDASLDCHYFESGTVNNTTEAVVHDSNLLDVGDFAYDQSLIKNRVVVYGAEIGDLPLIKTANDTDSQTEYGIKELILQDSNISTETQCQERADYELDISKDPPLVGEVQSVGLATIQPGERVRISAPGSNLPPAYYKIISYTHQFEDFMKTTLKIEKEPRQIHHLMRDRINKEQKLSEMANPNEMRYTWNFDYDSDSGTHTSTQITEGVLKTDGGASGNWVSAGRTETSTVTHFEVRAVGDALPGTDYYVSTDNGVTWQQITALKTSQAAAPPGKNLKLKVELNSASTQVDSLALLYK